MVSGGFQHQLSTGVKKTMSFKYNYKFRFILLALFAIFHAFRNQLEPRFIFTAFGFLLVGIGSWLFHMTLRYHFQLLDELPMIYATCIPFWSVFSEFKSRKESLMVGIGIFSAANLLTAIYLHFRNPTIHQTAYGVLNGLIIIRSIQLNVKYVHDKTARVQLHWTSIFGSYKKRMGIPYGFILEGHGWWHIFTGIGVYYSLVYEEYLRCFLTGTEKYFEFKWILGCQLFIA
ncbi:YDC1 Alkaline ceramidase YDC1 [Candida maltosa Xu316]